MEEMNRPDPVNVEKTLNDFVKHIGGHLVSEMIPKQNDQLNADYFFDCPEVIIELKCLQKDVFNEEEDVQRLMGFFEKWVEKGLIQSKDVLQYTFGRKQLPEDCLKDLFHSASKTIERAMVKANKQIIATKTLLNKPQAKGMLFLVNDGNYFLSHQAILAIIGDLLGRKYPDTKIDATVYFTLNQVSTMPDSDSDWTIWVPQYKNEDASNNLGDFINELCPKLFSEFLPKEKGIHSLESLKRDSINEGLDVIESLDYIAKPIAYKK